MPGKRTIRGMSSTAWSIASKSGSASSWTGPNPAAWVTTSGSCGYVPDPGLHAWTYHARDAAIVSGLKPFDWYLDYVVAGARYHGLPRSYIAALMRVQSRRDPVERRNALNRRILDRM